MALGLDSRAGIEDPAAQARNATEAIMQDDDAPGGTGPCFAHEMVGGHAVDPQTWRDVNRFRRAERERLYARRRTMDAADRELQTANVVRSLERMVDPGAAPVVAAYWPIRGELDLRRWMTRMVARGATLALPVVIRKGHPVEFHRWTPDCRMARGEWNIPVPQDRIAVRPDLVIVPLVGVDRDRVRLGNGGGYYDMTLTASDPPPRTIAVGQDFCLIASVFPQPWDVRMDRVVLGDGTMPGTDG